MDEYEQQRERQAATALEQAVQFHRDSEHASHLDVVDAARDFFEFLSQPNKPQQVSS